MELNNLKTKALLLKCLWAIVLPVAIAAAACVLYDWETFGFGLIIGLLAAPSVLLFLLLRGAQQTLAKSLAISIVVATVVGFFLFGLPAFQMIDAEPSATEFAQFSLVIYLVAVSASIICPALRDRFNASRRDASP